MDLDHPWIDQDKTWIHTLIRQSMDCSFPWFAYIHPVCKRLNTTQLHKMSKPSGLNAAAVCFGSLQTQCEFCSPYVGAVGLFQLRRCEF